MDRQSDGTEFCFINSPVGWLKVTADAAGITAVDFLEESPRTIRSITYPHLREAYKQLTEYFSGERMSFSLPLNPKGTEFQRTVWSRLEKIPFGSTVSYKELGEMVGCADGPRAIGMANNRNPLPILIPCHRVIGKSGDLTGYAPGVEKKKILLRHEGAIPAATPDRD